MTLFSFHLARQGAVSTIKTLLRSPTSSTVPGLKHAECMTRMQLGAGIFSPARAQFRNFVLFAQWESEAALEAFLQTRGLGAALQDGWHVRLQFLRRWGHLAAFDGLPALAEEHDMNDPMVAVTVARMKLLQVPRFIRWGRPVERLVRDHPGKTIALAAVRLPNTVSTFSIWRTGQDMAEMVHGHSKIPNPERHKVAMQERSRKDFHYEFTTLRFRALSEHGSWEGERDLVPQLKAG